jgi:hypothetical protein
MIRALAVLPLAVFTLMCSACRGGPNDESSRYCQNAITRLNVAPSRRGEVCDSCCHQVEVHRGRIEDGACVCYP